MTSNMKKYEEIFRKGFSSSPKNSLGTILNMLDSSIYITDMKTHKILFMNDYMKTLFGTNLTGCVCWESFHNDLKGPCEFCTNDKLIDSSANPTGPYVWEFFNNKLRRWYELHDQAIPWTNGSFVRMEIATDITERKFVESDLKKNHEFLEKVVKDRKAELERMNATLNVLLKKREEDQSNIENKIFANLKLRILPTIENLKQHLTQKSQYTILDYLESELKEITSSFSKKLSDPMVILSPMEIQIASMIKLGKSNKEISKILNRSTHTISNHRKKIRKKLNLQNKNINLRTFLSTF